MINYCRACKSRTLSHDLMLQCHLCTQVVHIKCIALTRDEYKHINDRNCAWLCRECSDSVKDSTSGTHLDSTLQPSMFLKHNSPFHFACLFCLTLLNPSSMYFTCCTWMYCLSFEYQCAHRCIILIVVRLKHVAYSNTLLLKPRSHLADLTADLSRPWWSGEVLWSRREVGKERGWVLEGPERSVNLVEVSPTVPGCFGLFKTIGSGRGWRAVVNRALRSRVRSLECR